MPGFILQPFVDNVHREPLKPDLTQRLTLYYSNSDGHNSLCFLAIHVNTMTYNRPTTDRTSCGGQMILHYIKLMPGQGVRVVDIPRPPHHTSVLSVAEL